jgi:ectoine hydroxylase-related dioxygenase (phytanoyl-CoA dioxygenase family)
MHPKLSLFTKMFIYLGDVAADGGCTSLVAGSHRWPEAPRTADYMGMWAHTCSNMYAEPVSTMSCGHCP